MKIIVSHDVDHLYRSDHYKDLIYPKLWVRETISFIKGDIDGAQWRGRLGGTFRRERNYIKDLIRFDSQMGIPSTFYFGMANELGMSYTRDKVSPVVKYVTDKGFEAGVHGISFNDRKKMDEEAAAFTEYCGFRPSGIRMHYVRYDATTFEKLEQCGYVYDTTEFDKKTGCCIKNPYRVGKMWEFPLCLMDGYLPKKPEGKKKRTLELLKKAKEKDLRYFTVLFHDYQFCDAFAYERDWYTWLMSFLKEQGYEFISYLDAVAELEAMDRNGK